MSRTVRGAVRAFIPTVALALAAAPAAGQGIIGEAEFIDSCAACHGESGKGDGPLAEFFEIAVPDLTTLADRNDGEFPFRRVFQIIDGRAEVRAHGERTMPVWGARFSQEVGDPSLPLDRPTREQAVRGRILELVNYIMAIQEPAVGEPLLAPRDDTAGRP